VLISVVTPVYRGRLDYLSEAYESLVAQEMPPGWEWEWLIQHDAPEPLELPAAAQHDPRVRPGAGQHGGPGVARNVALQRANGKYVRNLDADDVLPPTALACSIEVLEAPGRIGWTTCRALDLMPDGELVEFPGDPAPGRLPVGSVAEYWYSHDWLLPVHPTTITVRIDLLLAVGGWMALPTSEDTGMMLALNVVSDGWFLADVGLHYRQHPGQETRAGHHKETKPALRGLIRRRVEAFEALLAGGLPRNDRRDWQLR
jgi:hypothetical protein